MAALAVAGFGKIGSALVRGALDRGLLRPDEVTVWARSDARRAQAQAAGLHLAEWPEVLASAPVLLLALKPQAFMDMTGQLPALPANRTVVSVMGGWSAAAIGARLGTACVVRAMPSVAAAMGASTTALCMPTNLEPELAAFVRRLLGAAGPVIELPESAMDAATAVGASGVGFVCAFMEAIERAGLAEGLSPAAAAALALGAVEGAAAAVRGGMGSTAEVRAQVTSPAGTTAAGLESLRAGGLDAAVARAIRAATARAAELGRAAGA